SLTAEVQRAREVTGEEVSLVARDLQGAQARGRQRGPVEADGLQAGDAAAEDDFSAVVDHVGDQGRLLVSRALGADAYPVEDIANLETAQQPTQVDPSVVQIAGRGQKPFQAGSQDG